jgi:hypothetical protein
VSGYVVRDGTNGTTNLTTTGRQTLPKWAATAQGRSQTLSASQYGPNVDTTYPLGHYIEDYDFLGDLPAGPSYDLDQYNCRWRVTPEFPSGTYAYFATIDASGNPAFPYNIGRQFFGQATGGAVGSISETVTTYFHGGPNMPLAFTGITKNSGTNAVAVSWSSVDGATYQVDATPDFNTWTTAGSGIASGGTSTTYNETSAQSQRFYRTSRTALASYDTTGFDTSSLAGPSESAANSATASASSSGASTRTRAGAAGDRVVRFTIVLDPDIFPPLPPLHVPVQGVTVGDFSAANLTRPNRYTIAGSVRLGPGAPAHARQHATIRFPAPPGRSFGPSYAAAAMLDAR